MRSYKLLLFVFLLFGSSHINNAKIPTSTDDISLFSTKSVCSSFSLPKPPKPDLSALEFNATNAIRSLKVQWDGKVVQMYKVILFLGGDETFNKTTTETSIIANNLISGAAFTATLTYLNGTMCSNESNASVQARTYPPTPMNVTLVQPSDNKTTRLTVKWTMPSVCYRVAFYNINISNSLGIFNKAKLTVYNNQTTCGSDDQTTNVTFEQLIPGENYSATVQATSPSTGAAEKSSNVSEQSSFQGTNPEKVMNLKVSQNSANPETSFDLTWKTPDGQGDEILIRYESSTTNLKNCTNTTFTATESDISVIPGNSYTVNVSVIRNGLESELETRHLNSKPCCPPYKVERSTYELILTWDEPKGYIEGFKIQLDNDTLEIEANKTSYTIGNLTSYTTYELEMYSWIYGIDGIDRIEKCASHTSTFTTRARDWVIGLISAAIALVILLVLLGVCLCRRRKKQNKMSPRRVVARTDYLTTAISIPEANLWREESRENSRVVQISSFNDYMQRMGRNENQSLIKQFEELKYVGCEQSMNAAFLPKNYVKNRYRKSILPYDDTRVLLSTIKGDSTSDYINANFIPGYKRKAEFIATQGPLPTTIDDFWRMIWEQNSRYIVMLTQLMSGEKVKCSQYWPYDGQPVNIGELSLELSKEYTVEEWTIRELMLTRNWETRLIKQFHYTSSWPDHGVLENTNTFIKFITDFRRTVGDEAVTEPITIHCSAGVGRTGTFIAMDRLLQHLKEHSDVDIFGIVYEMRKHRMCMVQTDKQYISLHTMVRDVINTSHGRFLVSSEVDQTADNIYGDMILEPSIRELDQPSASSTREIDSPTDPVYGNTTTPPSTTEIDSPSDPVYGNTSTSSSTSTTNHDAEAIYENTNDTSSKNKYKQTNHDVHEKTLTNSSTCKINPSFEPIYENTTNSLGSIVGKYRRLFEKRK